VAAAGITLSWFALALTREPVQPPAEATGQSQRQFWAGLPGVLRRDSNFRRFLVARVLMAVGAMGSGFVTVSAVQRWHIPDGTVGLFTFSLLAGQTIGNLCFGFLADRFGHKLSLEIGAAAALLAYTLALLAPSTAWYYAVFALMGINSSAVIVSGILMVMEFSGPERRPTYVGLANTAVGVVGMVAPLVGAWLASIGYGWLFAVTAVMDLAALAAMHWAVREPRWARTADGRNDLNAG
jgi:MFS family permease